MSVTITDEQYQEITRYLSELRNGDGFEIMNNNLLNNKLASFMATLPGAAPQETIEETIRRKLLNWSQPCP
jgi:phage-related protein